MPARAARRALVAASAALLVVVGLLGSVPASAALTAPAGLTPDRSILQTHPVLTWRAVPGATTYEVQVGTDPQLASRLWSTTTAATRVSPPVHVPTGQVWWRVRARGSAGTSPWTTVGFERADVPGPVPVGDSAVRTFRPPADPARLSWGVVGGATQYTLQVSTDPEFVDPARITTYTTRSTSYVLPAPQLATTYHWRVRADLDRRVVTAWSPVRSYRMAALERPVLIGPGDLTADAPSDPDAVTDVVLDWEPVPGARAYDVQVSTDRNFAAATREVDATGVRGTRYSPAVTLRNDQYWWRVRPVDTFGNVVDWDAVDVWTFRRHWPDQPRLEHPADGAVVGDPFFFQWTPVRHASEYVVEMSLNRSFEPVQNVRRCLTTHTTFAPTRWRSNLEECWPQAGGTYFWRVYAVDQPRAGTLTQHFLSGAITDRISAEVRSFTYEPERATPLAPAPGETLEVPVLRWTPVAGAARYRVTITPVGGGSATTITTSALATVPRARLSPGTYRWQVQTVGEDDRVGTGLLAGSQPRFTVAPAAAATGTTPEPLATDEPATTRFPLLQWTPVAEADRYRVQIRRQGTSTYTALTGTPFGYPAGSDDGTTWIAPGSYEWRVEALKGATHLADSVSLGSFTILPPDPTADHRVAVTGLATGVADTRCERRLDGPVDQRICGDLPDTPVLRWDEQPEAGFYKVYLSRDRELTAILKDYPVTVHQSMYVPTDLLPDSQAGSAYFWHVQPCTSGGQCAPLRHAEHAFNKRSYPVAPTEGGVPVDGLTAGSAGPAIADDVTLSWTDYLETVTPLTDHLTGVPGRTEARQYRVQVSTDPNFQSTLETAVVDQTTYTSPGRTYPEGPVYWRVQAIDGSRNDLAWSAPWTFTKRSPVPVPLALDTGVLASTGALDWSPLAFAASYDIEVYRADDVIGLPANRVYAGTSRQAAVSLPAPLPTGTTYRWRVRRVDADGRKGEWSPLTATAAAFRSAGAAPTLLAPGGGGRLPSVGAAFAWSPVTGASAYRFEREATGSRSTETAVTVGTTWVPTRAITHGTHRWRVSALDAAGNTLGSAPWRSFAVDAAGPVATLTAPGKRVRARTTMKVRFDEPVRGVSASTVVLTATGRRAPLRAKVSLDRTRRTVTVRPRAALRPGVTYTLTVRAGIRDDAGNPARETRWRIRRS